jgi:predicted AAA+ superfamily ATPase
VKEWYSRHAERDLLRLVRERPAVLVTGARQTGKTSLVRKSLPQYSYVTLDLPSEAEQAEQDPATFLKRHPPPLIIDEVQYAPGLFRHLKAKIDAQRKENGQFVLTGSHKLALMKSAAESLAGRVAVLELAGLSFPDLMKAKVSLAPMEIALRGSLPELWQKPELSSAEYYRSYVATYLERDLRSLLEVGSLRDFERFVRACALRSAQLLNKAELARDVGISPSTAGIWLSVLEASNQIFLLEPWFANKTKSLVKSPKLYLGDVGLMAYLMGVHSPADALDSPHVGALWETFVCSELRKVPALERRGDLFFWRDRTKEADFLFHKAGRFELFDAKYSEFPNSKEATTLLGVSHELGERNVKQLGLICRAAHSYPLRERVQALTLHDVLVDRRDRLTA